MSPAAREEYLATEVLTAAPQKLQLMLVEAAIRFGRRAELHWQSRENEAAFNALVHCQEIVSQLIAGLCANLESPLVRQVASVYAFIYRSLVSAAFYRDPKKLTDALNVLDVERETWLQVCDQLGTKQDGRGTRDATSRPTAPTALVIDISGSSSLDIHSISFEA